MSIMFSNIKYCVLVYTLIIASVQAQSPSELDNLKQLIADKQYSQAHQLSNQMMEEHAGEANFDYLAGVAAFQTQHYQEAVFAFERVSMFAPANEQTRTYLAFSYFKVKNYPAAKAELNKLLSLNIPEQQKQQARTYLQRIEEVEQQASGSQSVSLGVSYGYDSNVNSGTNLDNITIPIIGEIEVFANSRETSDNFAGYDVNYSGIHKLSQKQSINYGASLRGITNNDVDRLDRIIPSLYAGYSRDTGEKIYSISGYVQAMTLDDHYYRLAQGVTGSISFKFDGWFWITGLGLANVDNRQSDRLDMYQYNISNRFITSGLNRHSLAINLGLDDAKNSNGEHNGKKYLSLNYSYLYQLADAHQLSFDLLYQTANYEAIHPTFLVEREDDTYSVGTRYTYTLTDNWQFGARFAYTDKDSNIDLYSYDKSEAVLNLTYIY